MKKYRKVDEVMQDYVQSIGCDVNKDFAKLDLDKFTNKSVKKKKLPVYAWASIATACIIVLVLSISLPLTLIDRNIETPNEPTVFYYNIEDVNKGKINSLSDTYEILSTEIYLPRVESVDSTVYNLNVDNSSIGVSFDLLIFDELIDSVACYILYSNVEITLLTDYNNLANKVEWNTKEVQYAVKERTDLFSYEYMFKFEANGYTHYYSVISGVEVEIGELLDWMF